jgi:hypothetical protein
MAGSPIRASVKDTGISAGVVRWLAVAANLATFSMAGLDPANQRLLIPRGLVSRVKPDYGEKWKAC